MGELTDRQREVLQRLAAGLTYKQIGREFATSERTVQDYVGGIKRALGARTAAHAVDIAHRTGLFDAPTEQPTGLIRRVWDSPDAIRRRRRELNEALKDYRPNRKGAIC